MEEGQLKINGKFLSAQYIDPTYILHISLRNMTDEEVGKAVRAYVSDCQGRYENNEPFLPFSTLRDIAKTPHELQNKLLKHTQNDNQQPG